MIVYGADLDGIGAALAAVNLVFGLNVTYEGGGPVCIGHGRAGDRFRLRLRVHDSKGPGARVGHSGRRLVSACWHVHGMFFDCLPVGARVFAAGRWIRPGDLWRDWNIGSIYSPLSFSSACGCGSDVLGGVRSVVSFYDCRADVLQDWGRLQAAGVGVGASSGPFVLESGPGPLSESARGALLGLIGRYRVRYLLGVLDMIGPADGAARAPLGGAAVWIGGNAPARAAAGSGLRGPAAGCVPDGGAVY